MESFRRCKLVLPLVGLPARGKSAVGNKLLNFLEWRGFRVKLFNVGKYRRKYLGSSKETATSQFFDNSNTSAKERREELARCVMEEMIEWLKGGGDVAIFDATNTTRERRCKLHDVLYGSFDENELDIIFVECVCTDKQILRSNMLQKIRSSPDYKGMPLNEAFADLRNRIRNYEKIYETLDDKYEKNIAYIKLIDLQSKVIAHHIKGSVAHLIVAYLMSLHIGSRPIYILRSGQCNTPSAESAVEKAKAQSGLKKAKARSNSVREDPTILEPTLEPIDRIDEEQFDSGTPAPGYRSHTFPDGQCNRNRSRIESDTTSKSSTNAASVDTRANDLNSEKATTGQASTGYVIDWTAAMTLSDRGKVFSHAAAEFISRRLLELKKAEENEECCVGESSESGERAMYSNIFLDRLCVYSSTLPRTLDTSKIMSQYLKLCHSDRTEENYFDRVDCDAWSALNPMDTGMYAGVPLQQLHDAAPQEWEAWATSSNRAAHRITGGESIHDVMVRLEPLVVEVEREKHPVVVITHLSTIQVLLSYFRGIPLEDSVSIAVPQHSLIEIVPTNYGYLETLIEFTMPTSDSLPRLDTLPSPAIPDGELKEGFDAFSPRRAVEESENDWYSERQIRLSDGIVATQRIVKRPFGHYDNEV